MMFDEDVRACLASLLFALLRLAAVAVLLEVAAVGLAAVLPEVAVAVLVVQPVAAQRYLEAY